METLSQWLCFKTSQRPTRRLPMKQMQLGSSFEIFVNYTWAMPRYIYKLRTNLHHYKQERVVTVCTKHKQKTCRKNLSRCFTKPTTATERGYENLHTSIPEQVHVHTGYRSCISKSTQVIHSFTFISTFDKKKSIISTQ
jgi:hypothetical protein